MTIGAMTWTLQSALALAYHVRRHGLGVLENAGDGHVRMANSDGLAMPGRAGLSRPSAR
jgi:hypothetical protein